jgi:hypothetical protein
MRSGVNSLDADVSGAAAEPVVGVAINIPATKAPQARTTPNRRTAVI